MALQNNILSFDGSRSTDRRFVLREGHRKTVDACRQVLLRTVPRLMEQMFGKLDDALYELADRADNNSLQSTYFDAMREVRKDRERIEDGFKDNVLDCFDRFWSSGRVAIRMGNKSSELDAAEFSLVENEDLEEGLAFNNMISRGENRYYQELYGLNQRVSYLTGGCEVDQTNNPLAPAAICTAFHQVATAMSLDVPIKLVIYKQFEREVVDSLGDFYRETNNLLVQGGVLPRLTREVKRSTTHQPMPSAGDTSGDQQDQSVDDGDYGDDESDLQAEIFSTLQQLLGQRRVLPPAVAARKARMPVVDTSNLVTALSSLQRASLTEASSDNSVLQGEDIRVNLLRAIQIGQNNQGAKQISRNDEDAIDVISMLFEFILEDRSLADAMKALLSRLQIPMLKVAILDKSFFSRKSHPARRLLNSLAQAAIGWTDSQGREDGGLYAKIESIIERILTSFDNDIDLFPELTEEFTSFLEQEEKGSRVMEQRTAQVTQGKEQLQNARHQVFEEINSRLFSQGNVPEVVVTLLKDGWKDVLLLICLRQGFDSPEWQNALDLMDQLLWSIEPKAEKRERQKLLKEIPVLLKRLRVGLNSITYDQHKMARLFKELQVCHVNCLKGKAAPSVVAMPGCSPVSTIQSGPREGAGQFCRAEENGQQVGTQKECVENIVLKTSVAGEQRDTADRDQYQELAENIEIGTWLEVSEDSGTTYRAKLSWRSKISGSCLFVNRKGMKAAELTLQALATWLRSGKAVVLKEANVPLMDRALEAVVNELKDEDSLKDDSN